MNNRTTRFATAFDECGQGPAIVLVHGLGLARWMWRGQVPELSERFNVVSYDLIGHGETPALTTKVTLNDFADQLLELVDHLGVRQCAVIGFSIGGLIVRQFARAHPDRVWALVIANSAHRRTGAERAAVRNRADQARRHGPASTSQAAIERWFTADHIERNPATMAEVRNQIETNDADSYADAYEVLVTGDQQVAEALVEVPAPVQAITASDDAGNSVRMSQEMAREAARGECYVVPGLRHMGLLEAPALFNAPILEFLCRAAPPDAGGSVPARGDG